MQLMYGSRHVFKIAHWLLLHALHVLSRAWIEECALEDYSKRCKYMYVFKGTSL